MASSSPNRAKKAPCETRRAKRDVRKETRGVRTRTCENRSVRKKTCERRRAKKDVRKTCEQGRAKKVRAKNKRANKDCSVAAIAVCVGRTALARRTSAAARAVWFPPAPGGVQRPIHGLRGRREQHGGAVGAGPATPRVLRGILRAATTIAARVIIGSSGKGGARRRTWKAKALSQQVGSFLACLFWRVFFGVSSLASLLWRVSFGVSSLACLDLFWRVFFGVSSLACLLWRVCRLACLFWRAFTP